MIYNPVGKRAKKVYKEKSGQKDPGDFIKKGIQQLWKVKKGKPVPVRMPGMVNPSARYGPRTRQAGQPGPGQGSGGNQPGTPQVGAGEGEEGGIIGIEPGEGAGEGRFGGQDGDGPLYGELEQQEILRYLKGDLELEMIKPGKILKFEGYSYPIIGKYGPESLFCLEETVKASFLRQTLWEPDFQPGDLEESDLRYRLPKVRWREDKDAVVIFVRDVSGSISDEEMKMSYILTVLIEIWLKDSYKDQVRSIYVPHNHAAWEDSEKGYYSLISGGGTNFQEAYNLILNMLNNKDYPRVEGVEKKVLNSSETDIYIIHMTDGWCFDTNESIKSLEELMPHLTRFCYLETRFDRWDVGRVSEFQDALLQIFAKNEKDGSLRAYNIDKTEDIDEAMRAFFGKK